MRFVVLAYGLSVLLLLATTAMLWSQDRREKANRALRLFVINAGLWAATDLALALPVARGLELEIFRLASLFWIPSTYWFLLFVYRLTHRRPDALLAGLGVLVAAAVGVFVLTDLGLTGHAVTPWGAVDRRGPLYLAFTGVTAAVGIACSLILARSMARVADSRQLRSFRVVFVGGLLTLAAGLAANVVLPMVFGDGAVPGLASCSTALFVPFVYVAMYRYEFLTESRAQVAEDLFEGVADGIVLFDREGRVRRANAAARSILGAVDDRDAARLTEQLLGREGWPGAGRELTADIEAGGEARHLGLSLSTIRHRGVDLGRLVVITDLTELRRAESILRSSRDDLERAVEERTRELMQAQKMEALVTLAGGIAHDFNNLLAAIQGFATAAREELAARGDLQDDAEEILLATRQARDIVRQLLDFSRYSDRRREIVDVGAVAREVAGLMRISLPDGVSIATSVESANPSIIGDPSQVHQVIMNLCTNALHATRATGGTIGLTVGEEVLTRARSDGWTTLAPGAYVRVAVRDGGEGIPAEVKGRIFEPFFTTKGERDGTGLGLSMVLHILREHGGGVGVESEVGRGSTFTVSFPATRRSFAQLPEQEEGPAHGGSESLMVVDDKEQIGRMSRRLLEALGYKVTVFTDPLVAVEAFRSNPCGYDLLLTDHMMPDLTGLELAERVRALGVRVPIIMYSGNAGPKIVAAGRQIGISAFLDKPLSKAALAEAVRAALEGR
jgi:signal transduction histidine kinase/CheY-like chemotaxis protein